MATHTAIPVAAEGRKFGLYLLTSTQRRQKTHPNVVAQCDNLILMRMNSAADLDYLHDVFSFVPSGLLDLAGSFGLGQALVAGELLQPSGDREDGSANRPGRGCGRPGDVGPMLTG